jgi:hypothetical protein
MREGSNSIQSLSPDADALYESYLMRLRAEANGAGVEFDPPRQHAAAVIELPRSFIFPMPIRLWDELFSFIALRNSCFLNGQE